VRVLHFFSKTTSQICASFFQDLGETLVHYNLHWKAMHPAFKLQLIVFAKVLIHHSISPLW